MARPISWITDRLNSGDLEEHLEWYLSHGYTFIENTYENGQHVIKLRHNVCNSLITKPIQHFKEHKGCNLPECKNLKSRQTKLENHGDPTYNNQQKHRETCLSLYGVDHYSKRPGFTKEVQAILKDKYGDAHYNNREQAKQTLIREHGNASWNNKEQSVLTVLKRTMSDEEIEVLMSKDKLYELSKSCTSVREISDSIHADQATVRRYLKSYGLYDKLTLTNNSSYNEKKIYNYLITIIDPSEIVTNARGVIDKYELDMYIPSKKVAIEYNGLYWHSSLNKPDDYHYHKSKLCEEKGIRLIHVWEHEWDDSRKQPILKSIIKNALGITNNKIYARNTYCSIEKSASLREFVDTNNIAGFRGGKFAITLRDKKTDELLMTYIIGHAFFGKGKYQYEVIRGATKLNTTVVGGASKIWKYFISKFSPESCVYYIDFNYFNGNSIQKLGLQYITSQPGVWNWWVNEYDVRNREPGRNKEIRELINKGEVVPIYTAGTKVYLYKK